MTKWHFSLESVDSYFLGRFLRFWWFSTNQVWNFDPPPPPPYLKSICRPIPYENLCFLQQENGAMWWLPGLVSPGMRRHPWGSIWSIWRGRDWVAVLWMCRHRRCCGGCIIPRGGGGLRLFNFYVCCSPDLVFKMSSLSFQLQAGNVRVSIFDAYPWPY